MGRRIKNSYYEPLTSKQDIGKNLFYKTNTDASIIMTTKCPCFDFSFDFSFGISFIA
jgi:hypothetical protein